MKKFLGIITLAVMVLAVVPQVLAQDMARIEALQAELEQIQTSVNAQGGRPTAQQTQRMQEIQMEMLQAIGMGGGAGVNQGLLESQQRGQQRQQEILERDQQAQQQQQQQQQQAQQDQYPGETRGWPSNSIFSQCNLPNLRQPTGSGITLSYTYYNQGRSRQLTIFVVGGTQNHANELLRAIEAGGRTTYKTNEGWLGLPVPSGLSQSNGWEARISMGENRFTLYVGVPTQ